MCALLVAEHLSVSWQGSSYPARPIAGGAGFELLSLQPGPGWHPNPETDPYPYRRFVHASELDQLSGPAPTPPDPPMLAPLSASVTRDTVQQLSQSTPERDSERALLRTIHDSAAIRCGTRMVKPLNSELVAAYLSGRALIRGLCYRQHDVAHLRTPMQLAALGVVEPFADVSYVLRWRAVAPVDYTAAWGDHFPGLLRMPASHRIGPPILGTGFSYSRDQLIPEYVTADLDDLPLPVHTEILAYLPDGTEIVLFRYLAEHMWARVAPRRLTAILNRIPDVDPHQEYHPIRVAHASRLVGTYAGRDVEVDADPPAEFRARASRRGDRHPVDSLVRRAARARVAGHDVVVLAADRGHVRVRACRPGPELVFQHGMRCVERGVYEAWIPAAELIDPYEIEVEYDLPAPHEQASATD
ncbi:MAG: hypothetical protein ACRDTM_09195 [Micromonosporaceae bacterium]